MSQILSFKSEQADAAPAVGMVRALKSSIATNPFAGSAQIGTIAKSALSLEGYSENAAVASDVNSAVTALRGLIAASRQSLQETSKLSIAQEDAAIAAGFMGKDAKSFLSSSVATASQISQLTSGDNFLVIGHEGINGATDKRIAQENYDDRPNQNTQAYSITYNLNCAKQTEFGETFYPTVLVAPGSVGLSIQVRLIYAYQEVQRQANGSLNDFKRQNIIRAIIDATILQTQQTQNIPVYRKAGTANPATDTFQNFVSSTLIPPTTITVDGQSLTTSPLAVGAKFSILGISQTTAMLAQGLEDQSDAVDSSARITNVYVEIDNGAAKEFFKFDVSKLPSFEFFASPQANTRLLILAANTNDLSFAGTTLQQDGSASTVAALLGTNSVRLSLSLNGSIEQTLGDTQVTAGTVSVAAINDSTGNAVDPTGTTGLAILSALASAKVVGYDQLSFRTNSNRRNRGKLLDIQHVNYLYTVPLLPPVSAIRPVTETEANDGTTLSALITATRVQTANAAITAILDAQNTLKQYANLPEVVLNQPKLFGAAASLVTPTYLEASVAVDTNVNSIASASQVADVQATLINRIRDIAVRGFVQSGYGPASEAVYEGNPPKTTLLILTDPLIYRYLQLTGDLRLAGDQFDYKLVQSFDQRIAGKVFITFGHAEAIGSGTPDLLHFGCMPWRPELTVMLPMVRNGAQSMELTVQPSFRHITTLPILFVLNVSGISTVMGAKVAVAVNNHVV